MAKPIINDIPPQMASPHFNFIRHHLERAKPRTSAWQKEIYLTSAGTNARLH